MSNYLTRDVACPTVRHVTTAAQAGQKTLGQRWKWARTQKGWSHDRLAAEARTTRRHLIRIEKDEVQRPGADLIARVAEATEQPTSLLSPDEDDEEADLALDLMRVLRRVLKEGVPS